MIYLHCDNNFQKIASLPKKNEPYIYIYIYLFIYTYLYIDASEWSFEGGAAGGVTSIKEAVYSIRCSGVIIITTGRK